MRTSKGSCYLQLHLAILLVLLLVQSCQGQNWATFQNKHVNFPRSQAPNFNAYCNQMMVQRRLNPHFCKPRNTFINSSAASVQVVCSTGGTHVSGNLFDSTQYFSMIDCHNTGGTAPHNCRYNGKQLSRRIRVACSNGLPVHLDSLQP